MEIKKGILLLIVIGLVTSCSDFLSVNLQGELTQEAYPTTPEDALRSTNAVYSTLRDWHYNTGGFPILDIMSDDAYKGSNPDDKANVVGVYDDFSFSTNGDGLARWWNTLYEGIRRANIVIQKVPQISMNETLRNRYVAEARFLRALFYFDLVRAFGGVPLAKTIEPPLDLPNATADEVYTQIEEDLMFAVDNLPLKKEYSQSDLGRATKGAAQALLARMYLFRGNFEDAETYALAVINSPTNYDLEPNFIDANSEAGELGVESVFEIGAITASPVGAGGNQYGNTQGVRGTPNRGWGFNRPSLELRDAFDSNDPRLDATIIDLGEVIDGIEIKGDSDTPDQTTDSQGNVIEVECYNRKVWVDGDDTSTQWGHNRRLIRYADVLLMAAEALNENNKPGQALPYLNEVRERARGGNTGILPDITTTNKQSLRDIIYHERRVELALEGHRFWDLVRTGRASDVLGPLGFINGKHELLPIPQSEIDLSQGSITQNDNWD